jgi:hypothetical protein
MHSMSQTRMFKRFYGNLLKHATKASSSHVNKGLYMGGS